MDYDNYEATSPRTALVCAAVFMASTTLGVLVLLPASLCGGDDGATTMAARRASTVPAQVPANAVDVPRPIITLHSMEKRS